MANRCPDCNKFVSLDTDGDPEEESLDVDTDNSEVQCAFRIANACAECGTELTSGTVEFSVPIEDLTHHANEHREGEHGEDEEPEFEVEVEEIERDVRTEGKGRGMSTFYTVHATVKVSCSGCDWHTTGDAVGEIASGDMESEV